MIPHRRPSSPAGFARIGFALLLAPLLALFASAPARAAATDVPRLALHLLPVTSKNSCARIEAVPSCNGIVARGDLYPHAYFAYLLVTNGDAGVGIAGLQLGVDYDGSTHHGVDVFSWALCADLNFPGGGWPGPNTGNTIAWDLTRRCQRSEPGGAGTGVVAAAGYFYLAAYTPDVLRIIPRPVDQLAAVADCDVNLNAVGVYNLEGDGAHHEPSLLGSAVFSAGASDEGHVPCADPATPIPCLVSGLDEVDEGATASYVAAATPPGTTFAWSVTGSATVMGSASNPAVVVQAGAPGTFRVTVTMLAGGALSRCDKDVAVLPAAPSCNITGPGSISEGQSSYYFAQIPGSYDTVTWQITGDGVLTESSGLYAQVTAGSPGAFELTALVSRTGQPTGVCRRTITVNPFACAIQGPDPVPEHASHLSYNAGATLDGATYAWELTGDATVVGSVGNPYLIVDTGCPGTFDLNLTMSRGGRTEHCSRTITVSDAAVFSGPDANTKLLLHLRPVATHNACAATGLSRCTAAVTGGALFPALYFAYLVAGDASATAGLGGFQCGIDYDAAPHSGVDIFSWSLCASSEVPKMGPSGAWPAAGAGDIILWNLDASCQRSEPGGPGTGVMATAGYFYLAAYTPGRLSVTPLPLGGQAQVIDCNRRIYVIAGAGLPASTPLRLGTANFTADGATPGFNPCGANVAVQVTTWSAIKGLYATPAKPVKP